MSQLKSKRDVVKQLLEENPIADYVQKRRGKRVIRRILIANNGMAATKAIMSMRRWAFLEFGSEQILTFVAMATQDDLNANAEFIRLADTYVEVPSGKNINNYANVDLICKIAKEQSVDAVWPGWGHASENPKLPATLKELGITFIGPTSSVMSALGDKIAANILAQTAKVPSIPWSGDGLTCELTAEGTIPEDIFNKAMVTELDDALERAAKIGYPVMVKASEGGGGKGIRKACNPEELKTAFVNVQTEVVGSPIFMMQLCTQARHLEVQILGDEYGNTLALNGRDCSTQRRFQKIFEEGPPVIATASTFKEMERAAMRLTALVGYRGAGTVEYLYNAERDSFYFLELNPRLQVEHPVTEGITGVNLPATQLHIAMGIPLCNIPDLRRFYGRDPYGLDTIDFFKEDYPPITSHVLASRITAENPDEGFKPTSGKIHSVRFQSLESVWGYFSVGQKGGIHEFADSQFGHVFAKGKNRNEARKALIFALKNMDIAGDIRHPVDYLVDLLMTTEFVDNTIDTSWLDGLIAGKLIAPSVETFEVVFFAAVYRAHALIKKRTQDMLASIGKGQLVLLGASDTNALISFPLEIVFDGKKFVFQVSRSRAETLDLKVGSSKMSAKVREQPDGSLYVTVGKTVQSIKGTEEALGLRLMIGAATVMLPQVYDPSELRSDVNGKVVRYLHDEGATIAKGEPYIELEAMKMIMALKSSEAGKIYHSKSSGSIVSAGELLATLELADPSKVQKIVPFEGEFKFGEGDSAEDSALESILSMLDGYEVPGVGGLLVEQLFSEFKDPSMAASKVDLVLDRYLQNERRFAASIVDHQPYDQLLHQLIAETKDSPEKMVMTMVAHNKLSKRHEVVMSSLRHMVAAEGSGMSCMYVPEMKDMDAGASAVARKIQELAEMPSTASMAGDYGNVRYLAQQLLDIVSPETHEDRARQFRDELDNLDDETLTSDELELGANIDGGLDYALMVEMLGDEDARIKQRAIKIFLAWLCKPSRTTDFQPISHGDIHGAAWTQVYPVNKSVEMPRRGVLGVARSLKDLDVVITTEFLKPLSQAGSVEMPVNLLHIVVGKDAFENHTDRTRFYNSDTHMATILKECQEAFARKTDVLKAAGVGEICLILPQPPRHPRFAMFCLDSENEEWKENTVSRDMWPSYVQLLELNVLSSRYTLQRIHKEVRPTSHIFLGTQPVIGAHKAPPPELFMRGLYYLHIDESNFVERMSEHLVVAMEELEHAMLDPDVAKFNRKVSSRIFLHFMSVISLDAQKLQTMFEDTVNKHFGQYGSYMLKLHTDEIEVKIRIRSGEDVKTLRLSSSSLGGGYMQPKASIEIPDPVTGAPTSWEPLMDQASKPEQSASEISQIQAKRVVARSAGSMYVYDLPGMLQVAVSMKWEKPSASQGAIRRSSSRGRLGNGMKRVGSFSKSRESSVERKPAGGESERPAPANIMQSSELVMDWKTMELTLTTRAQGENNIGMIAWELTLKTPEYPEGRQLVLIANDVTFQAGSFGVKEDQFFQKASEYARTRGIPRVYVSCNSGARVGLVEELKSMYKIEWIDATDPGKGFEYLYLTKADYASLPDGTVQAHKVYKGDEERYVIDAVIGLSQKSTQGGIGVENLQGSGLIAGETSRAYNEIFTLSYITGRSVGIGAYLNRLGQRNIQMVSSPMILTGYSALNKLLGKNVYSSQDQLGGPQIMVPNGVTHQVVRDDQEGMSAILDWLSFVPKDNKSIPPMRSLSEDSWDRDVEFAPSKSPYDPRDMLRGVLTQDGCLRGFFDNGSFIEYLEGWGRTVVIGRARLGGLPMGVIAVETRSVERVVPADPANSESAGVLEPQAGQVWFPDSAFKTAQALRDFNRAENLPVIVFANWRGFSGGTRDMYGEILKYGAQIVDALVEYQHPIFIYIPPHGELRGGAWVVIDPAINPDKMEMYADKESRGGILEPPGIVEVKYRAPQLVQAMHTHDDKIKALDAKLAETEGAEKAHIQQQIKTRENNLLPLYTSIAVQFADLHDRAGRMKAKGVIREALEWKESRRYFFWRVWRRVLQDMWARKLREADDRLTHAESVAKVRGFVEQAGVDFDADRPVAEWLHAQDVSGKAEACRIAAIKAKAEALFAELPKAERQALLKIVDV